MLTGSLYFLHGLLLPECLVRHALVAEVRQPPHGLALLPRGHPAGRGRAVARRTRVSLQLQQGLSTGVCLQL